MKDERWATVPGTGGKYLVSSEGRVLSIHKALAGQDPIMKIQQFPGGRQFVAINGESMQISRLVASAFIPFDPDDGRELVDHINGDIHDNRVENLRWCTNSENLNFELAKQNRLRSRRNSAYAYDMHEAHLAIRKKIKCLSDGMVFPSQTAAAKHYGVSRSAFSQAKKQGDIFVVKGLAFREASDGDES